MEQIRPLGVQGPSVRARVYLVRRFSTTTSGYGDTKQWTENTIYIRTAVTGAKKESRKDKREVLREEGRGKRKTHKQIAYG